MHPIVNLIVYLLAFYEGSRRDSLPFYFYLCSDFVLMSFRRKYSA